MKLLLISVCVYSTFLLQGVLSNSIAGEEFEDYEDDDCCSGEDIHTESVTILPSEEPSFGPYEDPFFFDEWFTMERSLPEEYENSTQPENLTVFPTEQPDSLFTTVDDDWYTEDFEPTLRIEYTPYTALLYQEDEFGLEFLCPGYWLKKGLLLIRGDCWHDDVALNIDGSVVDVFSNEDLNLRVLHLDADLEDPEHDELHLANVKTNIPERIDECMLYMLREDNALFEKFSWATRPLPFKRARGICRDGHICLRTRVSAANGSEFALICEKSLVGILTSERSKYERVFGKLTLMDLSGAEPWIRQILEELENQDEPEME